MSIRAANSVPAQPSQPLVTVIVTAGNNGRGLVILLRPGSFGGVIVKKGGQEKKGDQVKKGGIDLIYFLHSQKSWVDSEYQKNGAKPV